jgi:hypothetical protein
MLLKDQSLNSLFCTDASYPNIYIMVAYTHVFKESRMEAVLFPKEVRTCSRIFKDIITLPSAFKIIHYKLSDCLFERRNINSGIPLWQDDVSDVSDECEISSSHGGKYEVQICLLGCTAV